MLELVDAGAPPRTWCERGWRAVLGTRPAAGHRGLGGRKAPQGPRADTRSVETHWPAIQEHTGALGREASGLGSVRHEGPWKGWW